MASGSGTEPGADAGAAGGVLTVDLAWEGDFRFVARAGSGLEIRIDGDAASALSPMELLLAALGSCGAVDVVDILRKGRQPPRALSLRMTGERRQEVPRRFTRVAADLRVAGAVERSRAERATHLAFEKYCSVRETLDPALPLDIDLVLEP